MNRMDLAVFVLESTFEKDSWYPPLKDALEGMTAAQACWKPSGEAVNSIWDNVNHLIYYKERLVANLQGQEWAKTLSNDETFNLMEQSHDDEEWDEVVKRAKNAHHSLRELLTSTSKEELHRYSTEAELADFITHESYHTGQIIQLRKLQGSWPSHS